MKFVFAATDLSNFEVCKCHIINKIRKLNGEVIEEPIPTRTQLEYQRQGIEIEKNYLDKIKSNKSIKLVDIEKIDINKKEESTIKALKEGADYIYQAKLGNKNFSGYPDFLKKVNIPSKFGDYSYEVIDVKRSKEPKQENVTQLLLYSYLLSEIQEVLPKQITIINGQSHVENKFNVIDFNEIFKEIKNEFSEYVSFLKNKTSEDLIQTLYEECEYHSKRGDKPCNTIPHELDLINVVDLDKRQRKKLKPFVSNLKELSDFKPKKIKGISENVLLKLIKQADIQYEKIKTQKSIFKVVKPVIPNRGFNKLPQINKHDLFFDIEGNPTEEGGHEYLFGVLDGSSDNFQSFWARTILDEEKAFKETVNYLYEHLSKYPEAHIYHYNHYEVTALKRLSFKYNTGGDILDFFLKNKKFIDLYNVVRQGIITSESGRSLKDLEIFYMKKRTTEVTSGADSVDQFLEWIEFQDNKILKLIEEYNKDDCISTKLLLQWLHNIKPTGSYLREVEEIKPIDKDKIEEFKYIKKKIKNLKNVESTLKELIFDMIEYHKREDKSKWWLFFDRFEKDQDELIDDREAIAGCEKSEYAYNEKGFPILTMNYPQQEYKIADEDRLVNLDSGRSFGKLIRTDYKNKKITIQATGKNKPLGEFKDHYNFGAVGPPGVKKLQDAMSLFAEDFTSGKINGSISDLLAIKPPKFSGKFNLSTASDKDHLKLINNAIKNLDNSYLFIQGPPGTGKTYSSAKAILELLKDGKKIAISSNSHKAINNLLSKLDEFANEEGFAFKGLKKFSGSMNNKYESENITATTESRPRPKPYKKGVKLPLTFLSHNYQLLACTKYELADPDYRDKFDFLFIDEAGQASIADVVISSLVAKNLILIGDPQQLAQPSNIIHPGDSGLSVLEYILKDQSTVKNNMGIFINETRRLSTNINKFTSSLFYDGRLKSHDTNKNRQLQFKDNIFGINEGLLLIETNHEDNSQNSKEEVEIIKSIYSYLLKQNISVNNQVRSIDCVDILVVAPYNVQVNQINQNLPVGNRSGTIDKFQGQEAAISILSMTASNAEQAPRGIDFLFDYRRLNVAVSRAQCLSIIIMNKGLFRSLAKNINQIMILNNFQRLREFAHTIDYKELLSKL